MSAILGMGNALVDIMILLKDDLPLATFGLPKGTMQLIERDLSERIVRETKQLERCITSGGSAANTIHGLSHLGIRSAFFGKVGDDDLGRLFKRDLTVSGIEAKLLVSELESGRACAFISADSERTFATYLGAAVTLEAEEISDALFTGYTHFHIEGYLVQNHALIESAVIAAKRCGLTVSLDLASHNVVDENLSFLKRIVAGYIDIVFANEHEARSFTGLEPLEAASALAQMCQIAVVKIGAEGSIIHKRGEAPVKIGVIPANCIDTTGAGDLYAAGFLYGLMKELPLKRCGELGALLAGNVIEVIGARMDEVRWKKITAEAFL